MDENTVDTDETLNIELTLPSVKDQAISAAVGLGFTIGAYALLAGGAVLYTKASEKISIARSNRRLKKLAALEAEKEELETED